MKQKKIVEIDCFNNFEQVQTGAVVENFYNFNPSRVLKNSQGVVSALFPKSATNSMEKELNIQSQGINQIKGLAYFKQYHPTNKLITHRLLIHADNKKVYINQMLDDTWDLFTLYELEFDSSPIVLEFKRNGVDSTILSSENEMKVWTTGYSPYTIKDVPIITSMCMNENILFCTIKDPAFKIWYAKDLNPENIGDISNYSGYISLEDNLGYARKILTFNEDVYVFRDYGITKINVYSNSISASQVYLSNTKIYANTVNVCGNNILFMTKDGLYSFNGVKVIKTKVDLLSNLNVNNVGATAASLGEKYYLALKMDFKDNKNILCENDCVNNAVLVIDACNFSYEIIRGVDVKSMLPVKTEVFEKMLVVFNKGPVDKIGEIKDVSKLMDENLPKFWSCKNVVKTYNTKLFTALKVNGDKDVKVSLISDDKTYDFTTYKKGVNQFAFKICSKDLRIEISSTAESGNVEKVELIYYEY